MSDQSTNSRQQEAPERQEWPETNRDQASSASTGPPIPVSFLSYVKSLGPGIIVVLTWLGAGDIVNSATAGGNYGYALMWAFVLSVLFRYLFVSIIAKYQICNVRGETVLGGLTRLHSFFPPFVLFSALLLGHSVITYLLLGAASACSRLTGFDNVPVWALGLSMTAYLITFRPAYRLLEKIFFVLAAILSISFLGLAGWAGPSGTGIVKGVFGFALPATTGPFDAVYVILAMIGGIAGGLGNLMYPYFVREKGWTTPAYRKVQRYDLLFGICVLIVLDLSVWVVGSEILNPRGIRVVDITSLALLLGEVLGPFGTTLFYVGLFAALFSNTVGSASAYSLLSTDAYLHWKYGAGSAGVKSDVKKGKFYRLAVPWLLFSPLFWILSGQGEFVKLTLLVNAAQVVLIPFLIFGIFVISAKSTHIGQTYRNRWWENLVLTLLFCVGCVSTYLVLSDFVETLVSWILG